jgi:hypothetical protein
MTNEEAITAAQSEIDQLELKVKGKGEEIDRLAELMKNQGLARHDGVVDPELVMRHEDSTAMVDKMLDRITDLRKQILTLRNE